VIETKDLTYLIFRRLQAIEKDRLPQILAINHSGEEETGGGEEEDRMLSNSSDEEEEEEKHSENLNTASLDSSFQSLSPADCSLKISGKGGILL